MVKLSWANDELRVGEEGNAYLRSREVVRLLFPTPAASPGGEAADGAGGADSARPVPFAGAPVPAPASDAAGEPADGLTVTGTAHGFAATAVWRRHQGSQAEYYDVELTVRYQGTEPVACALQASFDLVGPGRPTWLIPGAFYHENRLPHCERIYPRYEFAGGDPQGLVSDAWTFRADRAALPAVFAWNDIGMGALAADETTPLGISGVGFAGNEAGTSIWLTFPYREEPVVFLAPNTPGEADRQYHSWWPGEAVTVLYRVHVGGPDRHEYDPFVRQLYELDKPVHGLNPWMGLRRAAELTAHGLYRWHYRPGEHLLYETASFTREGDAKGDRPNMHVGWVSGAPYAYALLEYGRAHEHLEYAHAGAAVLNKIATGVAPAGMFWGEWRADRGWSQGWTPHKKWIQARTISEATLFMIRALAAERSREFAHPDWEKAVLSNLRYVTSIQRADGSFGAYYFADTGEVMEWEGAGGILWIAALLEGAKYFGEESFKAAAQKAGAYYRSFVDQEFIYGAPEDVHLTPTSEDGYNAVVAYVSLYEAERQNEWLRLAVRAADWTMTFRWTYNLAFPEHTMLAQFDFRSRGADQASPSNQHLHNYGLFCVPEMLRLWRYTGDDYYLDRTRDNLACFLQFVAREDGDFNAYKGMVTERFYNTNCFQPKGMLLTLSHAWSVGVTLYAAMEALPYERELNLPPD